MERGYTVKAAREMPRPCVGAIVQALGNSRVANNSQTKAMQGMAYFRLKVKNSYYTRSKPKGEERCVDF